MPAYLVGSQSTPEDRFPQPRGDLRLGLATWGIRDAVVGLIDPDQDDKDAISRP